MSSTEVVTILVAVIAAIAAVLSAWIAASNHKSITQLHLLINSNLARQIASEVSAAFARGQIDGIEQERTRDTTKDKKP